MFVLKLNRSISMRSVPSRFSQILHYSDDKNISKKPEEGEKKDNDDKSKKSAVERLNQLLANMQTDDSTTLLKSVSIPKAGSRKQKEKKVKTIQKENENGNEERPKDIVEAAKNVANLMGGDKQVESELLTKLLNHVEGNVAETNNENNRNLTNLIVGMKIDRTQKPKESQSRGQYVRHAISSARKQQGEFQSGDAKRDSRISPRVFQDSPAAGGGSVNLFGSEPLGIFKENFKSTPDPLETWSFLERKELKLAVTHPPANYFQKMALWTEQGKLWKFPIDNEQGLEEEAKVDFSEHVFIEQHLDDWCPKQGPIRHYMELVCVGLSKNPYITIQDKKDHVLWYRDYFEQKKSILNEVIQQQNTVKEISNKEDLQLEK